ncbi:hypothetical protein [Bosea beijingensis]|uniref:hypothetical protein n=1 Tax=Bosea beijingensis TaxID=3068632 RepID=UPI00274189B6|nr:hypothetical protein [Bosea sp. REN20]
MERSLRIIASSLVLLCGTVPARAAGPSPDAFPAAEDALCEPGASDNAPLNEAQLARCRQLWQERLQAARERSRIFHEQAVAEREQRRAETASRTPRSAAPVTVETFLRLGDVAYGDVVVTDKGPRVFVGKTGEPATAQDFVALDSPRSPHRSRAGAYDGAYPQPQRPQAAKPRPAAPTQQERKP